MNGTIPPGPRRPIVLHGWHFVLENSAPVDWVAGETLTLTSLWPGATFVVNEVDVPTLARVREMAESQLKRRATMPQDAPPRVG